MALKLSDLNPTDVQLVAPAPGGGAGPAPGAPPLRLSDLAASDVQVMPAAADVSGTEAALRGGLQGATLGFGDELEGAGRAVLDKLLSSHPDQSLAELYRAHRDYARAQNDAARQAHPYIYGAGNVAGGIAPALLTGGGSTAAEMIGGGAALGAAAGLGSSNADLTQGDVGQAAMDTVTGAAMGGAGGALAAGAGMALKSAAPAVSGSLRGSAEDLAVKASGATGKQAAEYAPDAGRQLLDRGIVKFGSSQAAMADRAADALEQSGKNIGDALTQLDSQGANLPTSEVISRIRARAAALGSDPSKFEVADGLNRLADRLEAAASGQSPAVGASVPLTAAEETKRGFQAMTNYADPAQTSIKKEAADVYRQAVEDQATQADPAMAQKFEASKADYKLLSPIAEASGKRALQLQQSPHGGLLDMTAAAGGAGVGALVGGPTGSAVGGLAGLAAKTLRPRYASMGAVTTDWLAKSVAQAPQAFGKYAAPLANAAARGPAALAATHYVLQQTDPEYREKIDSFRGPAERGDQ